MKQKQDFGSMFPFYLGVLGVVLTLLMFFLLVSESGWKGLWHTAMLLFVVVGASGAGLFFKFRQWAGLLFVLGGLGAFFSYMLTYADDPTTLGTYYPLVLFATAFGGVAGVWIAAEKVFDPDEVEEFSDPEKPSQ